MKKAARIVFKVEFILYVVALACCAIGAIVVSCFLPQIKEFFLDPTLYNPQPATVTEEQATALTVLTTCWVYIGTVVCLLGVIFTAIGRNKIETARNKNEIMPIGVLNCIFGSRVGAVFLFVTKQTEWPDGANKEY